jgi:hypothetical protein
MNAVKKQLKRQGKTNAVVKRGDIAGKLNDHQLHWQRLPLKA